jgi:DNA-binding NarL/FixJ family response regulator
VTLLAEPVTLAPAVAGVTSGVASGATSGRDRARMKIAIVDDHEVVREGLRTVLPADPEIDLSVVGEAATGEDAIRLLRRDVPDLVLVDYRLPDTTGDELCRAIKQDHPQVVVVVLSSYLSEDIVQRCLSAGAAGFVTKGAGLDELREVLRGIATGDRPTKASASTVVRRLHESTSRPAVGPALTPRQERVLELVVEGWTYGRIAEELHVSESTVRFHIQRLKHTLEARTKTELISKAIRYALVAPVADAVAH